MAFQIANLAGNHIRFPSKPDVDISGLIWRTVEAGLIWRTVEADAFASQHGIDSVLRKKLTKALKANFQKKQRRWKHVQQCFYIKGPGGTVTGTKMMSYSVCIPKR